jgi:hypothetical protein
MLWTKMQSIMRQAALALICTTLTGCYIPQVGKSSPSMRGRVLDSSTQRPVAGVVVSLHNPASTSTVTDQSGLFYLQATHRFYWNVVGPCSYYIPGDWHYGSSLDLSHPQYASIQEYRPKWKSTNASDKALADVLLTPKDK